MDTVRWVLECLPCFGAENLVLNGRRLRIEKFLGEGAFSYVYLVQDAEGHLYALKKIRCPFGAESVANAMREVEATRTFDSPLVISQVDSAVRQEPDGSKTVYILFPYYKQGTLQDKINQCAIAGEALGEQEVRKWARALANALRVMHRHRASGPAAETEFREDHALLGGQEAVELSEVVAWAHRDVKPANVMIDDNGRAVLMDLGSCGTARQDVSTRRAALELQDWAAEMCTLPYRAPELLEIRPGAEISEKVDIWSYGCTVYALMYLISPFERAEQQSGASLNLAIQNGTYSSPPEPAFSDGLKELVAKCLTVDPAERPSIDEVLNILEREDV